MIALFAHSRVWNKSSDSSKQFWGHIFSLSYISINFNILVGLWRFIDAVACAKIWCIILEHLHLVITPINSVEYLMELSQLQACYTVHFFRCSLWFAVDNFFHNLSENLLASRLLWQTNCFAISFGWGLLEFTL